MHACTHALTHMQASTHVYTHTHAHTLTQKWACWSWKWKANPVACCKHSRIDVGFFFFFLPGFVWKHGWQPQWIKYQSVIQLDLWPHGMKAPQGQVAGAWPPWDEGSSGTRCWSMTTMGWRFLRDKILEHDHHGSQHWQLLVAMTTLSFVGWPVKGPPEFLHVPSCLTTYAVIPNCRWSKWWTWTCWPPVFLHVLSCPTTCAVIPNYMCCHAWLCVLSCPTTCAVIPNYMCCHARLHVLSCLTAGGQSDRQERADHLCFYTAVLPNCRWSKWQTGTCRPPVFLHCCHTRLQVIKVTDRNVPTTCVFTCAVMPDYMCCHAWLHVLSCLTAGGQSDGRERADHLEPSAAGSPGSSDIDACWPLPAVRPKLLSHQQHDGRRQPHAQQGWPWKWVTMNMTVHPSATSSLISSHLPACLSLGQSACGIGDVIWLAVTCLPVCPSVSQRVALVMSSD